MSAHPCGQWCKKIRGRLRYFGPWADPDLALSRWHAEGDALLAGRDPTPSAVAVDSMTLGELANAYMGQKTEDAQAGRLSDRSRQDIARSITAMLEFYGGRRPVAEIFVADWTRWANALRKKWNEVTLKGHIQRVRSMFNWAYQSELISKPMRYGPEFVARKPKPTERKIYTAEDIRELLDRAEPQLGAMILLGVNGGYGNTDCSALRRPEVEDGFIRSPRIKTQVARAVPLWPETLAAIAEVERVRPRPSMPEYADRVFLTRLGQPWVDRTRSRDGVSQEFRKLAQRCGVRSLGFYRLRSTFRTVADEVGDDRAANTVMGHATAGIASVYVASVSDERLTKVTDHVRGWLGLSESPGK
ncbi:MAG: tyrosine-type recombinase/integrase [Planctomycetota bacterium]